MIWLNRRSKKMNKHETHASKRVPLQQEQEQAFSAEAVGSNVRIEHRVHMQVLYFEAETTAYAVASVLRAAYELGLHDGAEESL
jgi:radical SAM superfamily enzyme